MATSSFISYLAKDVPNTNVSLITAAAGAQTSIIGLSCTNTSLANNITANVYITRSGVDFFLVRYAPVPTGGSLVVVGGDQKVVLEATDFISVTSSLAASADVIVSVLELT